MSSSSDLGSAVSMSISNPSIPSVVSEASSVDPHEVGRYPDYSHEDKRDVSSDDTAVNPSAQIPTHGLEDEEMPDEGYSPDQEATFYGGLHDDSDSEDSSSDSDGGLVMSRRKSAGKGSGQALHVVQERRGTGLSMRSKKSSRSGSNNTMRKVRTRESFEEGRRSVEISEE
jgi:[calcium/calmodulin-dependent protein kinase] kinase